MHPKFAVSRTTCRGSPAIVFATPEPALTRGRLLAVNSASNVLGQAFPLAVAIVAIPILLSRLGSARFGVLTLAAVLIGYAGIFDLGVGRALTQRLARELAHGRPHSQGELIWSALLLMAVLGLMAAIAAVLLTPWFVSSLLQIPPTLRTETRGAFILLSICIPVVIVTTGLRGVLEAHQRFGLSNAVRIPLGSLTYLGPLAVLPFSHTLVATLAALLVGRVLGLVAFVGACLFAVPEMRAGLTPSFKRVRPLVGFGGWMTLSNVIGPILNYGDRFVVGAALSVTAVAYYATPSEAVTKLWVLPTGLAGVLFPAFASSYVVDRARTAQICSAALRYLLISLYPVTLLAVAFTPELLALWLGSHFAAVSGTVMRYLAAGALTSSLGIVSLALVQGLGRPERAALLQAGELVVFGPLLLVAVRAGGISAAAVVWAARSTVDLALMTWIGTREVPELRTILPRTVPLLAAGLIGLALTAMVNAVQVRLIISGVLLVAFALSAWRLLLEPRERAAGLRLLLQVGGR